MSRKISLDTRCLRACGIITLYEGDDVVVFKKIMLSFCNNYENISHYYFIFHDDADKIHIHFALTFRQQVRLKTLLNKISFTFNIDVTRIGVEKLINLNSQLRYFLHLEEDISKKRYDVLDIISDESIDAITGYLGSDEDTLNIQRLFALVMKYDDEIDLMYYLDLPMYHKYRHEIHTLYDRRFHLLGHYGHLKEKDNDNNVEF